MVSSALLDPEHYPWPLPWPALGDPSLMRGLGHERGLGDDGAGRCCQPASELSLATDKAVRLDLRAGDFGIEAPDLAGRYAIDDESAPR